MQIQNPATRPGFFMSSERWCEPRSVGGFDRVRLQALLSLDDHEAHLLAFLQGLEPRHLDCTEVHEHILAALPADESETLRIVEPLHRTNFTFCHAHALQGLADRVCRWSGAKKLPRPM